jgi:ribosomal protein S14
MPEEALKEADNTKEKKPVKIYFRCRRCEKLKPLEDMRGVTRFIPMLIVCRDCEKEIR